jgi:Cytochrome c
MDRTFSKRGHLISILCTAGLAVTATACSSPELPPDINNPVVIAEKAPRPISGGTLLVTSRGLAVAADSERDIVWLVDLASRRVSSVKMKTGDEPGRVVEDSAGLIHVALRSGGAVATLDPSAAKVLDRTETCAAPRGIAYEAKSDAIHVACNGGELVTLPAAGGAPTRRLQLDHDLRDVVVSGDKLLVSRFRAAEVLVVDPAGKVQSRTQPPKFVFSGNRGNVGPEPFPGDGASFGLPTFSASGAWRMVPLAGGGVAVAHQRALDTPVIVDQPGGYGGRGDDCGTGISHPTITTFDKDGKPAAGASPAIPHSVLPVDVAVNASNGEVAMVAAGSDKVIRTSFPKLAAQASTGSGDCSTDQNHDELAVPGEPVAVAYWNGTLITQTREPSRIYFIDGDHTDSLTLPGESVADTGHALFHHQASPTSHVSCGTCHLEGHDDGHVWKFDTVGERRTQMLGGNILNTAPFHWDGDMEDVSAIMSQVFVDRMGGAQQGPRHVSAVTNWIGSIPAVARATPVTVAESAVKHGADVFAKAKCATCHSGAMLTNNATVDVGTGKAFQVPSLVGIASRAPFMHNGCAKGLKDRFAPSCGGGDRHGKTSDLTEVEINDLVSYLERL